MQHQCYDIDSGKPVTVPICQPQIPHGLTSAMILLP